MICRGLRRHAMARLAAWTMTLALVGWVPGTGAAFAATPQGVGSALTVASNPIGAAVYLDGKSVGETPLTLDGVTAGDYRVKVVKDGYLENSRVVTVVGGSPASVEVNLTRHAGSASAVNMQVDPGASAGYDEGGSSKKWLLIGVGVAAAGAGVYLLTRDTNTAPRLGGVLTTPSGTVGIPGITEFEFIAQASDEDDDALSYSWDFGDGATGTGDRARHVYQNAGDYSVTVTVSDGEESVTGGTTANVRALTGTWRGNAQGDVLVFNLTQNGNRLSGTWGLPEINYTEPMSGSVSAPRNFSLNSAITCNRFSGAVDADGNTLRGSVTGCPGYPTAGITFTMRRN